MILIESKRKKYDSVTSIGDSAFEGCNFQNDIVQELFSRFGNRIF